MKMERGENKQKHPGRRWKKREQEFPLRFQELLNPAPQKGIRRGLTQLIEVGMGAWPERRGASGDPGAPQKTTNGLKNQKERVPRFGRKK